MPFLEQLVRSIDDRIRELQIEIASLQDARSALLANGAGGVPPRDSAAERLPRRRTKRRRTRRSNSRNTAVLAETAEHVLAESDGLSTAALAEQAGGERDQVLALLRELEAARRVRRTGQRRGTRWHVITDEDRIRERAAELASRGGKRRPS